MPKRPVILTQSWLDPLESEFAQPYMQQLSQFLRQRRAGGARIFPPAGQIFAALDATPPDRVRVVILGQDPYHNPGQAHGLSFSVNPGVPVPPSLRNIFQELHDDLGLEIPRHGNLRYWADQGVLLMNSVLTVEQNQPGSHQGRGWERFTDRVIRVLNDGGSPKVFLLWGAQARRKCAGLDGDRHCILEAPHPSPLSAHRGFFGCRHFSRANAFLEDCGLPPIDWRLPDSP